MKCICLHNFGHIKFGQHQLWSNQVWPTPTFWPLHLGSFGVLAGLMEGVWCRGWGPGEGWSGRRVKPPKGGARSRPRRTALRRTAPRRTTLRRTALPRTALRQTALRRTVQNFALFFPSPATIFILSSPSWGSSRGISVMVLKAGTLKCARLEFSVV